MRGFVSTWGWPVVAWGLAAASYVYGWARPNNHCSFLCGTNKAAIAMALIGLVAMFAGSIDALLGRRWLALLASAASAPVLAWVGFIAFLGGAG